MCIQGWHHFPSACAVISLFQHRVYNWIPKSVDASGFGGATEVPTLETIDTYMAKLHTLILDSPQENEGLIASVREIVGRLNFDRWERSTRHGADSVMDLPLLNM